MGVFSEKAEAVADAKKLVERAAEAPKFMVAAWTVKDGVLTLVGRTTWEFPVADFEGAVKLLRNQCIDEQMGLVVPPPLPARGAEAPCTPDNLEPSEVDEWQ